MSPQRFSSVLQSASFSASAVVARRYRFWGESFSTLFPDRSGKTWPTFLESSGTRPRCRFFWKGCPTTNCGSVRSRLGRWDGWESVAPFQHSASAWRMNLRTLGKPRPWPWPNSRQVKPLRSSIKHLRVRRGFRRQGGSGGGVGEIGAGDAVQALRRVIAGDADEDVISAASEALGNL